MRRPGHDRLLRWLVVAFGVDTVTTLALSLFGVAARTAGDRGLEHPWAGLALVWFVLLAAVSWRAARQMRRLRGLLGTREEQIEVAAATSHEWLWESDPRMVVTYCSPAVAAFLGRGPEEIIGRSLLDFACDDDRARLHEVTEQAIRDGAGWSDVEARWKHADGHPVVTQGSALPVHDERGAFIGFRGTRRLVASDAARHRLAAVAARVQTLLDNGELAIALQPILTVDGEWTAVEALARFPDGRPPNVWFAEAADAGLGVELELLAVRRALAVLAELPAGVCLSFNASPALIVDPRLAAALRSSGAALPRLVLELTEHSRIGFYADIATALEPLRALGLRLAVDDAGAGYASFAHVLQLRPDVIKLDRSLIAGIGTDPARRALVTAIVLLGLELGASLTGEGVETPAELSTLAELGVNHAQGYLLARPSSQPSDWLSWRSLRWPHAKPQPLPADQCRPWQGRSREAPA